MNISNIDKKYRDEAKAKCFSQIKPYFPNIEEIVCSITVCNHYSVSTYFGEYKPHPKKTIYLAKSLLISTERCSVVLCHEIGHFLHDKYLAMTELPLVGYKRYSPTDQFAHTFTDLIAGIKNPDTELVYKTLKSKII